MLRFFCAVAAAVISLTPAFAARHVWTGAASGYFSNPANWTGGSPAGDPQAELSFPASVAQTALTNDLPNLTVRSIAFSAPGYSIGGLTITIAGGTITDSSNGPTKIDCNLALNGGVTFVTFGDVYYSEGMTVAGIISGSGPVTKSGSGLLTFAGNWPNLYSGETHVTGGELRLWKTAFVTAVPGDLFLEKIDAYGTDEGHVTTMTSEQIADSATIRVGESSQLSISAVETVGPIVLERGGRIQTSATRSGTIYYTGRLILGGDVTVLAASSSNSAQLSGNIYLGATRTFTVDASCCYQALRIWNLYAATSDAGAIFAGSADAIIDVQGSWSGPTTIEGPRVAVTNAATAVTLRGGSVSGTAASVTAHAGTVRNLKTGGDLRIGAAATFIAEVSSTYYLPVATAGGVVRLGGTLDPELRLDIALGTTHLVLDNKGTLPVSGAFANAPEGAVIEGFRVSYKGGDGNDLTLTDVRKIPTTIQLNAVGTFYSGNPVTLNVYVRTSSWGPAAGSVTLREGNTVVGTVTLDAYGNGSTTFVPSRTGAFTITARYDGSATVEGSEDSESFTITPPPPRVTAVQPASVVAGQTVTVTVTGTNFTDETAVVIHSSYLPTTRISSTELRATWTVPRYEYDSSADVSVQPSPYWSSGFFIRITGVPPGVSALSWEPSAVSGPVAPGAQSVWLRGSLRPIPYSYRLETQYGAVLDDDNDGNVRWALSQPIPDPSIFLMVDVQTGVVNAGTPADTVPVPLADGATFLRGTNGAFSNIALIEGSHDMMWVRPGAGAWWLSSATSPVTAFSFKPMYGTTPPPAGVEPGDVFVGLHNRNESWYGGVVDEQFRTGPGVLGFGNTCCVVPSEGAGVATVTVMRTDGADGAVSVNFTTVDGTAVAGVHYQARAGTLTLAEGEIAKNIEIPLIDDAMFGGNTEFRVRLSDPVDAAMGAWPETPVLIVDNDPKPALSLGPDVTVNEGDGETRLVTFAVTLTGATRLPVTVSWSHGWTDGYGWWQQGERLVFAPGETQKTVSVTYKGNTVAGPDRSIGLNIDAPPESATIVRGTATATVLDDDDYPGVTILDATIIESSGLARVAIQLSEYSERPVTVSYGTESVSAFSGRDYTRVRGTVTLNSRTIIEIPVVNDTVAENDETFLLILSNPVSGRLLRNSAVVTISDDDDGIVPSLTIDHASVQERNNETVRARFTFRLSSPTKQDVTFSVRTIDGTAGASYDFTGNVSYPVRISAGQQAVTHDIYITDDRESEPAEWFLLEAFNVVNATLAQAQATGTILDDDSVQPSVTIDRVEVFEGDSGLTQARFEMHLTRASSSPVTVSWQTVAGTADHTDFQGASGQSIFAPGETSKTFIVNVIGDTGIETDETFELTISAATNATIGKPSATCTIVNDDHPPKDRR